jgi:alkylation response protein AidB-like acyl-CoA dehydrogenase
METNPAATDAAIVAAAQALAPRIRACADQIEREGRLPGALLDALADAGLLTLLVPRSLGGSEASPETYVRVVEVLARADGSAAWCVAFPAAFGMSAGTLPEAEAREIFSDRRAYLAGSAVASPRPAGAPPNRATAVDRGYRVTGRWSFASGCRHATWLIATCDVYDGDAPRVGPDGGPAESRFAFLPAAVCRIIDAWDVTGLRGTGSDDFAVDDVFVPESRTLRRSPPAAPWHAGPLYAFCAGTGPSLRGRRTGAPWLGFGAISIAAVCLGVARGALDAFVELAGVKLGRASGTPLRESPVVQAQVGRAEATLGGARAYLLEAVREMWATVCRTGHNTEAQQVRLRLAGAHAAALSAQVVDTVWSAAGASAIVSRGPIERRFRDVHVATQNAAVGPNHYGSGGRLVLGLDG